MGSLAQKWYPTLCSGLQAPIGWRTSAEACGQRVTLIRTSLLLIHPSSTVMAPMALTSSRVPTAHLIGVGLRPTKTTHCVHGVRTKV